MTSLPPVLHVLPSSSSTFYTKLTERISLTDSVEQQAFGRVFRIGQHKETYVSRLVIKNSVDTRILDLQAEKLRAIDRALQDVTEGCSTEALSITDLVSLFGCLRDDGGVTQVVSDYEEDEEDERPEEGDV